MSSITELKDSVNIKTLNFVLLTFATAGIYPLLWVYRNTSIIENLTKRPIANEILILCLAASVGFSSMSGLVFGVFGFIASFAAWVLYIVWTFKAKSAIEEYALRQHKIDLRMNGFFAFLFTVFYINYCINDLPEAKRKQAILLGQVDAQNTSAASSPDTSATNS